MRKKTERGLSMNRRKPRQVLECASLLALWQWKRANRKRQRTGAVQDATARSAGSWSQCMRKSQWALHEPLKAPPGFGAVRQSSGALAMEASQPKAPEDWRSPRRYRAIRRFVVPMHAKKP